MACKDCDGRNNCIDLTSSACVDYTGKVSKLIKDKIPCKPNVNDILEELSKLVEAIQKSLGSNVLLEKNCFTFNNILVTQQDLSKSI